MSRKELKHAEIISKFINGDLSLSKASLMLKISIRQIKRLCKRYKEGGVQGLDHRGCGKESVRRINSSTREGVLELIKNDYPNFSLQLIKEQLEQRNDLQFSHEWIRGLMIKEGLAS